MGIQLKVKNFRCLRDVDWSPDGVCMLVGPNGSGKTTLFDALSSLKFIFEADRAGFQRTGRFGGPFFRHLDATTGEPVELSLRVEDWEWTVSFPVGAGSLQPLLLGETLTCGDGTVLTRTPGQQGHTYRGRVTAWAVTTQEISAFAFAAKIEQAWAAPGAALPKVANEKERKALSEEVEGLIGVLRGANVFGSYANEQLRWGGSQITSETRLSSDGLNAFCVLRNWRDKRDFHPAHNFVISALRDAFPGLADELEFDTAGTVTNLNIATHGRTASVPVAFAANGWLAGLLHLMAVASAKPGAVVMIDEFENSLHPFAIRSLVRSMREWAAEKNLTVVLAGHSPALLDEFNEHPEQVFVMEPWRPGQPSMPRRLTDYRDPEWLKHFSLGELYRHEEFGGPLEQTANGVPAAST